MSEESKQEASFIRREFLREILERRDGRDFLWWMLGLTRCIGGTSFVQGFPDATAFNCGEVNVGNQVLAEILNASPGALAQMMMESQEHDRSSDDNGNAADRYDDSAPG